MESPRVISYTELGVNDPRIAEPEGIKHMLYAHQQTILHRKDQIARARFKKITSKTEISRYGGVTRNPLIVMSDAQRVDLPPGSGKTAIEIVDKFINKINFL